MLYLKSLFKNKGAVSPVIGVVLMVAITVILAAAIGSSVLGEGSSAPAPQANINIKVNAPYDGSSLIVPATVILEHLGGDPINFDSNGANIKMVATIDGTPTEVAAGPLLIDASHSTLSVGDTVSLELRIFNSVHTDVDKDTNGIIKTAVEGATVNIKIIDVATQQLICEQDVRF